LRASVGGGSSSGFVVELQTIWCPTCRILRDVKVGERRGGVEMQPIEARCPRCSGRDVKPWEFGEPCPRCGGEVVATDEDVVQWD